MEDREVLRHNSLFLPNHKKAWMFSILVMIKGIDLYDALRALVDQIPEGMVSTPHKLAVALGDPVATRSISDMMEREEFNDSRSKVTASPPEGFDVFVGFDSEKPLERLARIQQEMAKRVKQEDYFTEIDRFAGVDAAYRGDEADATCVVMDRELGVVDMVSASMRVRFPYIPGYLMFREAPVIKAAARRSSGFDVLFVNGHGVAHPRRCGLASCVGLDLDIPTIGVARRRLVGEVDEKRDDLSLLIHEDKVVGAEVEAGGSKVYVSVGHKISLETCINIVQMLTAEGRFPEPLRRAHMEASTEK